VSTGLSARWVRLAAARIAEARAWLTELDAAIGDGDHGINLERGFSTVVRRLDADELPSTSDAALLVAVGQTITGTVGGASGALYGRALIRAGEVLASDERRPLRSDGLRLSEALDAGVAGIAGLGRAHAGEKTMLDALLPAATALRDAAGAGAPLAVGLGSAADAADRGATATIPLLATKGRASYLGERSIGHLDPGAASSAILLRALADVAAEG
jgi:dihydroxyacetone kinase-like protein